jgi:hypothetical protein
MKGGDGTSMAHCMASLLVNIAHIPKVNDLRGALPRSRSSARGLAIDFSSTDVCNMEPADRISSETSNVFAISSKL